MSKFESHLTSNNLLDGSESSSDDDDSENLSGGEVEVGEVRDGPETSRMKREVSWCGVEESGVSSTSHHFPTPRRIVWPPSTATPALRSTYIDPRSLHVGNPNMGPKMQLYCRNGFFLAVYPNGQVRGTRDEDDKYTFLEMKTGGMLPEHVRLQGIVTKLYVAMDKKGRLYGERDPNIPATVFIESFHGQYNNYLSRTYAHLGWYIGLKRRSGKFKRGPKTKFGQKAIKFLPRRTKFQ